MIRLPTRATRTETRFPYTTLYRSPGPRKIRGKSLGVEAQVGQRHYRAVPPPGLILRLGPRILHHGRQPVARCGRNLCTAARARTYLSRQAPGQLGSDRKSTPSELQSLMRISYAVFCLKKKKHTNMKTQNTALPTPAIHMTHINSINLTNQS